MNVTKEQARSRFTTLSSALQDAIFSEQTADTIAGINEQYKVPEGSQELVASYAGWVLLGFLPQEKLAGELVSGAHLDPSLAKNVSDALNEKIFKALQALISSASASDINSSSTKVMRDIATSTGSTVPPSPKPSTPPPAPLSDLSSKGWSHMAPTGFPVPPKNPASFPSATIPTPSKPPTAIPVPGPKAAPAPAPAPVMIQQGEKFAAPARNADFHLERKMGAQMDLHATNIQPKAKPAVIEFAPAKNGLANTGAPVPPQAPKTAAGNNAGFRPGFASSLSSIPTIKDNNRQVTEITAAPQIPKVPAMPQPPAPPKPAAAPVGQIPKPPVPPSRPLPPSPPQAPGVNPKDPKVIIKDFTQ